uniref:Uncharacterized protein n=1 Tax=viral metagenome TaxID=1070528 RepID=A0A6H1ZAL7_9ZZZZ
MANNKKKNNVQRLVDDFDVLLGKTNTVVAELVISTEDTAAAVEKMTAAADELIAAIKEKKNAKST